MPFEGGEGEVFGAVGVAEGEVEFGEVDVRSVRGVREAFGFVVRVGELVEVEAGEGELGFGFNVGLADGASHGDGFVKAGGG